MKNRALFPLALLLFGAMVGGVLFYIFGPYLAYFNSDAATANVLATKIVRSGSLFPSEWWYVNGDIWVFYKHLLLIPAALLGHNGFIAHALAVLSYVVLGWVLVALLLRRFGFSLVAILLVGTALCVGYSPHYMQEVFGEAAYTWHFAVILGLILAAFTLSDSHSKWGKRGALAVVFALVFVLVLSNPARFGIYYIAPFGGAWLLMRLAMGKPIWNRRLTSPMIVVLAAMILAMLLRLNIQESLQIAKGMDAVELVTLEWLAIHIANSFGGLFFLLGMEYGPNTHLVSLAGVLAVLKLFILPFVIFLPYWVARSAYVALTPPKQFLIGVALIGMALIFGLYSLTWLHKDLHAAKMNIRYILPFLLLWPLVHLILWEHYSKIQKLLLAIGFVAVILDSPQAYSPKGWQEKAAIRKEVVETLRSVHIPKGYAPYWDSHLYTALTSGAVEVRPVKFSEEGILPDLWLSSDSWFREDYTQGEVFMLVPDAHKATFQTALRHPSSPPPKAALPLRGYTLYIFDQNPLN